MLKTSIAHKDRVATVGRTTIATTVITITLWEDDDGDGTYTELKDRWAEPVRVYPDRGGSLGDNGSDGGLLDLPMDVPFEVPRRPTDGIF